MSRQVKLSVIDVEAIARAEADHERYLRRNEHRPPPLRAHCILFDEATQLAGYCTGSLADRLSGRAQCKATRCTQNLLVRLSEESPGRRHKGRAPEYSLRGKADAFAPSCALDVADPSTDCTRPMPRSSATISALTGETKRRVEQIIKSALETQGAMGLADLAEP
jgi:hypothetical protein